MRPDASAQGSVGFAPAIDDAQLEKLRDFLTAKTDLAPEALERIIQQCRGKLTGHLQRQMRASDFWAKRKAAVLNLEKAAIRVQAALDGLDAALAHLKEPEELGTRQFLDRVHDSEFGKALPIFEIRRAIDDADAALVPGVATARKAGDSVRTVQSRPRGSIAGLFARDMADVWHAARGRKPTVTMASDRPRGDFVTFCGLVRDLLASPSDRAGLFELDGAIRKVCEKYPKASENSDTSGN